MKVFRFMVDMFGAKFARAHYGAFVEKRWKVGRLALAGSQLDLWVSRHLFYGWQRHDCSPICLDPRGARMGGPIVRSNGRLYRLGQDGSEGYGGALEVFLISKITGGCYEEQRVGRIQISAARGPHTFLSDGEDIWLDFYTEVWTPFAGARRLVSKLSSSAGRNFLPDCRQILRVGMFGQSPKRRQILMEFQTGNATDT